MFGKYIYIVSLIYIYRGKFRFPNCSVDDVSWYW